MTENQIPKSAPRTKQDFMDLVQVMRQHLADMEDAISDFESTLESIPSNHWPINTANFQRAWHRAEFVKQLRGEASYLRDIARSLGQSSHLR